MSIDRCKHCEILVDTDDEPESYVEIPDGTNQPDYICLCTTCREAYEEDLEALALAAR